MKEEINDGENNRFDELFPAKIEFVQRASRKSAFSAAEDRALIIAGVEKYGNQWPKIVTEFVPRKTSKQCSLRWRTSLDPAVSKREDWSQEKSRYTSQSSI